MSKNVIIFSCRTHVFHTSVTLWRRTFVKSVVSRKINVIYLSEDLFTRSKTNTVICCINKAEYCQEQEKKFEIWTYTVGYSVCYVSWLTDVVDIVGNNLCWADEEHNKVQQTLHLATGNSGCKINKTEWVSNFRPTSLICQHILTPISIVYWSISDLNDWMLQYYLTIGHNLIIKKE
jgi:hypothetical protein